MRRLILLTLVVLASCIPTYKAGAGRVSFVAEGGELFFVSNTGANIGHGGALVSGAVTSERATYRQDDLTVLKLPEGEYGARVRVGQYTGPVSGKASIVLIGSSAAYETELEVE